MNSTQVQGQSKQLQQRFLRQLDEVSTTQTITYYDFLVVAKKLDPRFQQTTHLTGLKNYFIRHNNILSKLKLASMLIVNTKVPKNKFPGKIIVKFSLEEISFDSIKEATNEDEDFENEGFVKRRRMKSVGGKFSTIQSSDKISLMIQLKVGNIMRKLEIFTKALKESSLFSEFDKQKFTYDSFKKKVDKVIGQDKIKDHDLKSVFFLLDSDQDGIVSKKQIGEIINPEFVFLLTDFLRTRINPNLIKSTELKRGSDSIYSLQMYKAKNPWTIDLSDIEQSILSTHKPIQDTKKPTKPRFGPLRHFHLKKPQSQKVIPEKSLARNTSFQKNAVQKLLKASRPLFKKLNDPFETITSKLRRLYVQKVILPRERMFEQYRSKQKYAPSKSFEVQNERRQGKFYYD